MELDKILLNIDKLEESRLEEGIGTAVKGAVKGIGNFIKGALGDQQAKQANQANQVAKTTQKAGATADAPANNQWIKEDGLEQLQLLKKGVAQLQQLASQGKLTSQQDVKAQATEEKKKADAKAAKKSPQKTTNEEAGANGKTSDPAPTDPVQGEAK